MVPGRRRAAIFIVVIGGWLAAAQPVLAQGSDDRRWQIDVYGGLARLVGADQGSVVLPAPGGPIATSSPIFPSRRVPSWFFGDGADLLNAVNQQFGAAAAIAPLDAGLAAAGIDPGNVLAAGVRVRRALGGPFSAEVGFDVFPSSIDLSGELVAAAATARDSFVPAFEGLLATGPFTGVAVDSSLVEGGSSLEMAVTGAIVYELGVVGAFVPHLTAGAGVITGAGSGGTLDLEGRYRFLIVGEVPIDETDRLTIRHETQTTFAGLVGAGLRRDIGHRWGVRIDGRVFIAPPTRRVVIDTNPVIATATPADFVESFTAPAIQFSNDPATGRESSLGGPALQGFEVLAADGLEPRVLITGGVFFRF